MESRKVLIFVKDTPFGESDIREKLRLSIDITAGYKEHEINLVLIQDAVYLAKIPEETNGLGQFLKSFKLNNSRIYVDMDSMKLRNINFDSLSVPYLKLEREELMKLLVDSDMTISL